VTEEWRKIPKVGA